MSAAPPGREATDAGDRVVIRPLVPSDLECVAAIYNAAVRDGAATLDTEEKSLSDFTAWLAEHDQRYVAIGALLGGSLVGYGALSPFAARGGYRISAEISIYVDPAHTGRGVGTSLAANLVEHGQAAGFTTILALATSANIAPRGLVTRLGFVYTGTLRSVGFKHGQLIDLVCYQLFFEDSIKRCGGAPLDVWRQEESVGGRAYAEQVASQPAVVGQLVGIDVPQLDLARPVVFTGIGTSLHACKVATWWIRTLTAGAVRPMVLDAHDLALGDLLRPDDQVVVVSHRGTKRYPNEVLRRAGQAGARTIAVTGVGDAEPAAEVVLRTCAQERASTHTVSYTAALAVLARLVGTSLGVRGQPLLAALEHVPQAIRTTLELPLSPAAVEGLVSTAPHSVLVSGTHLDAITAEEAALKIKEGTYRWAEAVHGEFALHGTPAVYSADTTSYLIRPNGPDGGRHKELRALLSTLGAPVYVCADDADADLPFASTHPLTRPLVAIVPFQRLVEVAARALGADPDLTHLEAEPWASAIRAVAL